MPLSNIDVLSKMDRFSAGGVEFGPMCVCVLWLD